MRLIAAIFTAVIISGCSTLTPNPSVKDPTQKAMEIVPFEVQIQPLNLDQYKNPNYFPAETKSGQHVIALTPQQFHRHVELLTRLREHIRLQREALKEMKAYYERNLDRQKVDSDDKSSAD